MDCLAEGLQITVALLLLRAAVVAACCCALSSPSSALGSLSSTIVCSGWRCCLEQAVNVLVRRLSKSLKPCLEHAELLFRAEHEC